MLFVDELTKKNNISGRRVPDYNPWPHLLVDPVQDNETNESKFERILNVIMRGCVQLASDCDKACVEIGSDSKYFDIYKNSTKDYRTQYGVEPFMPLSSVLRIFHNNDKKNEAMLLPVHSIGSSAFKFQYGTRDVLQEMRKNPLIDNNPQFLGAIDSFNRMVGEKSQYSKNLGEKFLGNFVRLTRWIYNLKVIKPLMTPHHWSYGKKGKRFINHLLSINSPLPYKRGFFASDDLILTNDARYASTKRSVSKADNENIYNDNEVIIKNKSDISLISCDYTKANKDANYLRPVYAISNTPDQIIHLVEERRDTAIKVVIDYLMAKKDHQCSKAIQNILDLNIVPINFHALMREIPLANLYNYSYTFDRIATQLYCGDVTDRQLDLLCDSDKVPSMNTAKEALVALLIKPLAKIKPFDMNNVVNMLLGLANIGELNRPKLLSDQLYGKVIFGDLFTMYDHDDLGPGLRPARGYDLPSTIANDIIDAAWSIIKMCNKRVKNYIFDYSTTKTIEADGYLEFKKLSSVVNDIIKEPCISCTRTAELIAKLGCKYKKNSISILSILLKVVAFQTTFLFMLKKEGCWFTDEIYADSINTFMIGNVIVHDKADVVDQSLINKSELFVYCEDNIGSFRADILERLNNDIVNSFKDADRSVLTPHRSRLDEPIINIDSKGNIVIVVNPQGIQDIQGIVEGRFTRLSDTMPRASLLMNGVLHYSDGKVVKEIIFDDASTKELQNIGRQRLDTVAIRNIIFIVNLYRTVRMKLQRDLNYSKDIILRSASITRPEITEFYANQVWSDQRDTYEEEEGSSRHPRFGLYRRQRY